MASVSAAGVIWHKPLRGGHRLVQCHGCFDLLHLGHIRHLEAARRAGDALVVTVTPDRYVAKGPHRPAFTAEQRAEALAALACVDAVAVTNSPTAADAIYELRPAVFAKGPDYTEGTLDRDERAALEEVGAELLITQTDKWSSTALLRDASLSPDAAEYLARMRGRYAAGDVRRWLEQARGLRVLVIGDAIRDEYHYVDTLGKSGKDPILAAQFVRAELFTGGAWAVEQHARSVSDHVYTWSGPVTVKRRFIERYPFQKLFEVYEMDEGAASAETTLLMEFLAVELKQVDLVIVADYGHGLLTPPVIELLTRSARHLAVNTQANAGNHGFNTISKYPRANFLSLSERELRLDARDQVTPVSDLAVRASVAHGATVLTTRGEKGCVAVSPGGGYAEAPALTTHAVDRTGAGDAVFGVTACCAAVGMPLDLLTFMASVVGTQAVGIVGNARYIERASLWAAIEQALG